MEVDHHLHADNNVDSPTGQTSPRKISRRLQRLSPPSLQLAPIATGRWEDIEAQAAIPLLSPLLLSPEPWVVSDAGEDKETGDDLNWTSMETEIVKPMLQAGWRHPALAAAAPPEPASLPLLFQHQCGLAHGAQASSSPASLSFPV